MSEKQAKLLRGLAARIPRDMVMTDCQSLAKHRNTNGGLQHRHINPARVRKNIARRAMRSMEGGAA